MRFERHTITHETHGALKRGEKDMNLILLIVLIFFVVGGLPTWGYHSYGYGPSGIGGLILIILLILLLTGRL
jgi:hypothetical protein